MALTPGELDRLLLASTAMLAIRRRERGLRLNVPEATALIADAVCEWARDGDDLPTVLAKAAGVLRVGDVLPGVPSAVPEIRVEARFDDGTRLVIVKDPFGVAADPPAAPQDLPVGQTDLPANGAILAIANEAPTAIALTSHIHLAEVNPRLRLDRSAAYGMRLAVPTGSTVWIDPGATIEVAVTPIRGQRIMIGNTGAIDGSLDDPGVKTRALALLRACGYLDLIDGQPRGDVASADHAVAVLMDAHRGGRR